MKINDYFEQLKLEYPIADALNSGEKGVTSYNGTANKIDILHEIEYNLTAQLVSVLENAGIEYTNNFSINCDFNRDPYYDDVEKEIRYRYILLIFFAVTNVDFIKSGFYYEGVAVYRGEDDKSISDRNVSRKKKPELDKMVDELKQIITDFIYGNLVFIFA